MGNGKGKLTVDAPIFKHHPLPCMNATPSIDARTRTHATQVEKLDCTRAGRITFSSASLEKKMRKVTWQRRGGQYSEEPLIALDAPGPWKVTSDSGEGGGERQRMCASMYKGTGARVGKGRGCVRVVCGCVGVCA